MRKPAKPRIEFDIKTDACTPVRRDATVPADTEGTVGMANRDGFSDEVNLSDAWLVDHARHGDHQAFAILVRRYERKLIRVLARLVRDPNRPATWHKKPSGGSTAV